MSDEPANQAVPIPSSPTPKPSDELIGPQSEFHDVLEAKEVEAISTIVRREVITAIRHEMHSGPMPSPSQLEKYEKVLPGTAMVIRDEFQENGRHIREMEKTAMSYAKEDNDGNRRVAERLVWGALVASSVLGYLGQWQIATAIAVSTVGAVITGFLIGKRPAPDPDKKPEDDDD